ncbi:hypothetical protein P0O24_02790 [Methanotrichaceae archaeon M04Ac]|uniref:Uncharacterized protein n=1 Tax=Candidatus Methanocrinis alkalitolerans TaxID=3033395 RepID=A0ABT5XCR8_9EURY|nr:hypothetical protein [Candidatus Methanocrinis alkalitolerans]MCR3883511.1 hypothetical protein [Methanothrix sp.]MDF0592509.1 hypothetical protein [Candidatus Methanocrinis alkalitolerans]
MMEPGGGEVQHPRRQDGSGATDPVSSMGDAEKRLTALYPKPLEGEKVPISFLAAEKRKIGWSPEEGRSVQIGEDTEIEPLKRVREINEVQIFNWLTGREGVIELSDREMEELLALVEAKNGERLVFTRVKVKGRLKAAFALEEEREPRRWLLSERLRD